MSRAQEYRLRSFEVAYVQPHLQFYEENVRKEGIQTLSWDPSGEAELRWRLLEEAVGWIDLGRWCGYFSSELEPAPIRFGNDDIREIHWIPKPVLENQLDVLNTDWARGSGPGPAELVGNFGEALRASMEDLTDDRMEFLRLYLFTPDTEWQERLAEVAVIVREVEAGQRRLPASFMDRVAWAIQGPESNLQVQRQPLPSDWRTKPLYEIREDSRAEVLQRYKRVIEQRSRSVMSEEAKRDRAREDELVSAASDENDMTGSEDFPDTGGHNLSL